MTKDRCEVRSTSRILRAVRSSIDIKILRDVRRSIDIQILREFRSKLAGGSLEGPTEVSLTSKFYGRFEGRSTSKFYGSFDRNSQLVRSKGQSPITQVMKIHHVTSGSFDRNSQISGRKPLISQISHDGNPYIELREISGFRPKIREFRSKLPDVA